VKIEVVDMSEARHESPVRVLTSSSNLVDSRASNSKWPPQSDVSILNYDELLHCTPWRPKPGLAIDDLTSSEQ
jgi:hypothetical protein